MQPLCEALSAIHQTERCIYRHRAKSHAGYIHRRDNHCRGRSHKKDGARLSKMVRARKTKRAFRAAPPCTPFPCGKRWGCMGACAQHPWQRDSWPICPNQPRRMKACEVTINCHAREVTITCHAREFAMTHKSTRSCHDS